MRASRRLLLVGVVLAACAACGGSDGAALTSNPPDAVSSASPAAAGTAPAAPAGEAVLAFDDGSPGRLTAVRSPDGTTTATLELDGTGAPVTKVGVSIANVAADVTGLEMVMTPSGGAWTGSALLPLPGIWSFEVTVQRDDGGFLTEDLANTAVML